MLGRALILAAVTLLTGCFAVCSAPAQAQNLEAGKSPSQIFAGACTACHKSPRGLLKSVPAGSLQGFLRQHYTTSPEMASLLSAFLVSNGAADTRYVGTQPKPAKDAKSEPGAAGPPDQLDRFGRRLHRAAPAQEPESGPRETAKPDADGRSPQVEPGGRNARRMARPGESSEGSRPAAEGQGPTGAGNEGGPEGRKSAVRQKLSKRRKHGSEEPAADAAKQDSSTTDPGKLDASKPESAKTEPPKTEPSTSEPSKPESAKSDSAKDEPVQGETAKDDKPKSEAAGKEEGAKPSAAAKSESTRTEPPKTANGGGETPPLRADPVPAVTPAPPAGSATASGQASEPAAAPLVPAAQPAPAPAVTASAPPPSSPTDPVGPPVPPISK
jgi:hypothetical protein